MKKKIENLIKLYESLLEIVTNGLKIMPPQPEGFHWVNEARLKVKQEDYKMIIDDLKQLIS